MKKQRVVLLGGTREARALALRLAGNSRHEVLYSLAGVTEKPLALLPESRTMAQVSVRSGGFGGTDGLREYLVGQRITCLIDATHPFAATISAHARAACTQAEIPRLQLLRPAWTATEADHWLEVSSTRDAFVELAGRKDPHRVFLSIGSRDIEAFEHARQHWFLIRSIEPPCWIPEKSRGTVIVARGPFHFAAERALLESHEVDIIVSKNSGGSATFAKIEAARALGIPILMVARPPPQPGAHAYSADQAHAWLDALR